jgi:hypothetical protein
MVVGVCSRRGISSHGDQEAERETYTGKSQSEKIYFKDMLSVIYFLQPGPTS